MLAANATPPHTTDQHRHAGPARAPNTPCAALHNAPTASTLARCGSPDNRGATPPRATTTAVTPATNRPERVR